MTALMVEGCVCDRSEKVNLDLCMVLCQTFVPTEICGGIDLAVDLFARDRFVVDIHWGSDLLCCLSLCVCGLWLSH